MFDALLEELQGPEEGEPLRHLDVLPFAADLFALGAKSETLFRNRSALYEISNGLERFAGKKLKKAAREAAGDAGVCVCKRLLQV